MGRRFDKSAEADNPHDHHAADELLDIADLTIILSPQGVELVDKDNEDQVRDVRALLRHMERAGKQRMLNIMIEDSRGPNFRKLSNNMPDILIWLSKFQRLSQFSGITYDAQEVLQIFKDHWFEPLPDDAEDFDRRNFLWFSFSIVRWALRDMQNNDGEIGPDIQREIDEVFLYIKSCGWGHHGTEKYYDYELAS